MNTLSVGLLLPTSTIRPMSKQFSKAFEAAAKKILESKDIELEVIPDMIGTGGTEAVDKALDKFLGYHDVDIAAGIVTRYGIQMSLDKFQNRELPFLFCNLGEHFTPIEGYNDYVFLNTVHLWQQCYQLGYYTGGNMGSRGISFCSMYDSGYSLLAAFDAGLKAANPEVDHRFHLMPMPASGGLSNVKEELDKENLEELDFIFSLVCGEEATLVLETFKANKKSAGTKLLGLPFLVEPGKQPLEGLEVITCHHDGSGQTEDPLYQTIFQYLGEFAGTAIARAALAGKGGIDHKALDKEMLELDANRIYQSTAAPGLTQPIGIYQHTFDADNKVNTTFLESKWADMDEDEDFMMLRNAESANWMNPYLAI